jgi:hypothetical protein
LAIEDRDPNISAAVALARREAAQAQSARDRAANKEWWGNGNHANIDSASWRASSFGGGGGAPRQKKGGGKGGPKGAGNSKGGSKGGKRKRARHY